MPLGYSLTNLLRDLLYTQEWKAEVISSYDLNMTRCTDSVFSSVGGTSW